jgi:excinuclease UvrABC nuclease subunit
MTKENYKIIIDKIEMPEAPGVYFFHDADKNIIYIGKATNLRDRTKSYFASDLQNTRGLRLCCSKIL